MGEVDHLLRYHRLVIFKKFSFSFFFLLSSRMLSNMGCKALLVCIGFLIKLIIDFFSFPLPQRLLLFYVTLRALWYTCCYSGPVMHCSDAVYDRLRVQGVNTACSQKTTHRAST